MKKFLAFLCLLVIIVLFPLTLLSTVAKYRLFTPTTIKRIVRSSQMAENLPALVVAAATSAQTADTAEALDPAQVESLVAAALPPEQVNSMTDEIVDAIGLWWNTDKPIEQIDLTLDLTTVKQNLAPALEQQFNTYVDDLPTCDDEVLPTNFDDLETFDPTALQGLDCIPANIDITSIFESNNISTSDALLQNVPDQIEASSFISEQLNNSNIPLSSLNQTVNQLRSIWRWLNIGIWIGWGVIGFSLLLMVLLRLRPGYAAFSWLGWTFFILTIELAPLSLLLWLSPKFILPWFSSAVNTVSVTIINTLLTEAMRVLAWPVIWTLAGTAGTMLGCFILRLIIKHAFKPKASSMHQPPAQATSNIVTPAGEPPLQPPPQ